MSMLIPVVNCTCTGQVRNRPLYGFALSSLFPWATITFGDEQMCAPLFILAFASRSQWCRTHPLTDETGAGTKWPQWNPWHGFYDCMAVKLHAAQLAVSAVPLFIGHGGPPPS